MADGYLSDSGMAYGAKVPVPEFILALRARVGHAPLWLAGATAVVLREGPRGEEVLLVRRADSGEWSPICGIVDPGEDPHVTAVREVQEEAGVVAEVERLVWVSVTDPVTYSNGDQTQYIDHTFRCRWVEGHPFPSDGEATEARFFAADDLPDMPAQFGERVIVALANEPEAKLGRR